MNTSKQINIMVLLVFAAIIATGAYTIWDPHRASDARATQLEKTVDRGAYLFAQNCRTCHGDRGEGGSAANRLSLAPPLNRPDLQGKPAADQPADPTTKAQQFKFIVNTITCGRVGKAMPTWGQSQGGPLSDTQIRQLATFITEGTAWDTAAEFAAHTDDANHLTLTAAVSATDTTLSLSDVKVLGKGTYLRIDDELVVVTAVDAQAGTVTVDRKQGSTKAAAHDAGASVLTVPPLVKPEDAAITQPACGQNLPPVVPTPAPGSETPQTQLEITAQGTAFDKSKLLAVANQPLTLTFHNNDAGTPHNIHFFQGSDATGTSVAQTDIQNGVVTETLNFGPLAPGDYYYQCDVHPNMFGTLTAQ
jgi:mono/diheme cytochrome c family protein/plastocyanin